MKITFLHPDLGIGGAERLVVDAALALKSKNHEISIVTNHHDPKHSFVETTNNSLKVEVVGEWIPRSIFGRCFALFAYLRMMYAAFVVSVCRDDKPDVIFCDQVSACIPILKWKKLKVIFYCHFPDQLLTDRKSLLKRLYRWPLDWFEEKTTAMADIILVNSKFTAQTFRETFPSLEHREVEVVYPAVDVEALTRPMEDVQLDVRTTASTVFLSLNRFERKKDIGLAIRAMGCLRDLLGASEFPSVHLVLAGGLDARVPENAAVFRELEAEAAALDLCGSVTLLRSPDDAQKRALLHSCTAVLYTPQREHCGIVPMEAAALARPVLAVASGGPLETVAHGETGFLEEPEPVKFAARMCQWARDRSLAKEMGLAGARRVRKLFDFRVFARRLEEVLARL